MSSNFSKSFDIISYNLNLNKEDPLLHQSLQTTSISKLLLKYCIPAIISMMTVSLYNAVDRIFIGHIPGVGSLALTGLGTLIPFTTIILACELLITYGAIANLSLKLGEQKTKEAEDFLNQVPLLAFMISIFLILLFYLFNEPLLYLFGATSDTIGYAKDYLNILTIGIPFYIIGFSLMGIIRSEGNPKRAALILMMSCLINIILDPLFIFGLNLGISGAALATIVSQATVFFYVVYYYTKGSSNLKLNFKKFKPKRHLVQPIITFGLSTALIQLIAAFVQILLNQSLKHYGTALSIGSFTTISTIYNLVMMPVVGINQGMIPIIGYNFGQRNYKRVKQTFLQGTIASTVVFTIGFLLIYSMPTSLISFFNPDKSLLATTVNELKLYAFSLPLCALAMTAPNFFQSIGNSKISIWLVVIRQMIILIPSLIILPKFLGLNGVWLAQPITDLSVSLICFFLISQEFRRLSHSI